MVPNKRWFASLLLLLAGLVLAVPAQAKLSSKEWSQAKKEFERAVASSDSSAMVAAIQKIAADESKRAVDLLVKIGEQLEDMQVFEAVRDALGGMRDPEAVDHMLNQLSRKSGAKDWTLRCVLCEALISQQGEKVTMAIAERLEDKVPYVVSAAAKALGKRKDPAGVDPLIDVLEDLEKNKDVTWIDVKQALTDITGQDFPDSSQWRDYWKAVGATFDPNTDRGDKEESTTVVREDEAAQFFDEKIIAKRIMFVIDVSGSMEAEDPPIDGEGGGKRIERVKQELAKAVRNLKGDVHFNIIAYSHVIKTWKPIRRGSPLHRANGGNKGEALKWIQNLKADGATHTDDALKKSFDVIEVNTIVLLSDGAPSRINAAGTGVDPINPQEILDKVKAMNRLRNAKIYTFCFEVFKNNPQFEPLLKFMDDLATQNGGKMSLIR
jgi:hypothetical protein